MCAKVDCSKSHTFQAMELHPLLLKGLFACKYRRPTPIQRKTIPLIMNGIDVVAMARTGSGKTAAFLIPAVHKLVSKDLTTLRNVESSLSVLILSPTRELAIQTFNFLKKISKYCKNLRFSLVLGGESMDQQFDLLSENSPHILIATPGRILHLLIEMEIKVLRNVDLLVLDEADRLFELGFSEQLNELLARIPIERQTLLFSATLPEQLTTFAKAKLRTPFLMKLDTETKLSNDLTVHYVLTIQEHKLAALCMLILEVIPDDQQVMIFVATKHDVELLGLVLDKYSQKCSCLHGSMDQTARRIALDKFKYNKTRLLIVTDIVARGIDIPLLDNVINYNFPAKPKLFVHRVGRVARNGRLGTAYSLLNYEELPWLFDLHKFLGHDLIYSNNIHDQGNSNFVIGSVPITCIDMYLSFLNPLLSDELCMENNNAENGLKAYLRFSQAASKQSVERYKNERDIISSLEPHPLIRERADFIDNQAKNFLCEIKNWRNKRNIFEISACDSKAAFTVMKNKRCKHDDVIVKNLDCANKDNMKIPTATSQYKFKSVLTSANTNSDYFIPYEPVENNGEGFRDEFNEAIYDIHPDDTDEIRKRRQRLRWDRKKKKFVSTTNENSKKIKTENKNFISASYKSNHYKKWMEKNKTGARNKVFGSFSDETKQMKKKFYRHTRNNKKNVDDNFFKSKLKSSNQILKIRNRKQKIKSFQARRASKKLNKKKSD